MISMGWNYVPIQHVDWVITPRHAARADDLIALVADRSDLRYKQCGRILVISKGYRENARGHRESCLGLHIAFTDCGSGIWMVPTVGAHPSEGFHPAPHLYCRRVEEDNPCAEMMGYQGRGLRDFLREWGSLHNGDSNRIYSDHRTLFGEEFPIKKDQSSYENNHNVCR